VFRIHEFTSVAYSLANNAACAAGTLRRRQVCARHSVGAVDGQQVNGWFIDGE